MSVIPQELQTPFRNQLTDGGYKAVSYIRTGLLVTHLIGPDLRALCGLKRPVGDVSDMTPYVMEQLVCQRCRRILRGRIHAKQLKRV